MTLDLRKYRLLKMIVDSTDENLVGRLESVMYNEQLNDPILKELSQPVKDKLDLDTLMIEQGFKHPTKEELDEIIEEADIQEPIEELIQLI